MIFFMNNNMTIFRDTIGKTVVKDEYFLFVVHLTRTIEPYLLEWLTSYKSIGVISIPYSENKSTKQNISQITSVYEVSDYKKIPALIKNLCQENEEKRIILVEIGGYSAGVSHYLKNVVLSIEDTNQGYWEFKKFEKNLNYPVVSIAQTILKSLENRLVGQSVVFSTERILRDYFNQGCLTTQDVLVLSYGQIGRAVCNALRGRFSRIYVHDEDPTKQIEAYLDGFNIVNKIDALPNMDIIIGVSGNRSIQMSDVPYIRKDTLLISGSSKQVEFPYQDLELYLLKSEPTSIIEEIEVIKGKNFFIAFKGQPINFIDDSAFGDAFEIIMSAFLQCVKYYLGNHLSNYVYDLPKEYQDEVANLYYKKKILHFSKNKIDQHKAATAYLINYDFKKEKWRIMMVDHAKIGKVLPIGGHVEENEAPDECLNREIIEETGLNIKKFWNRNSGKWQKNPEIYTVQIEEIPKNKTKNAHIHEDYMYVGYINFVPIEKLKKEQNIDLIWYYIDDLINSKNNHDLFPEVLKTLFRINELAPAKIEGK